MAELNPSDSFQAPTHNQGLIDRQRPRGNNRTAEQKKAARAKRDERLALQHELLAPFWIYCDQFARDTAQKLGVKPEKVQQLMFQPSLAKDTRGVNSYNAFVSATAERINHSKLLAIYCLTVQ